MAMIAKNRIKSAWTPLSNEETNNKIFEERRDLIGKWYQKWSSEQRCRVLEDLLQNSKRKQLEFVRDVVHDKVPPPNIDFTRVLPRVISLYIFSFLDPSGLCRASQVCWYWHDLCERDELWMPRCIRVGWYLPFTPSPYERGVWKRNFIENIKLLIMLAPKKPPKIELGKLKDSENQEKTQKSQKKAPAQVPWRASDPVPKDIWRNNYLENDEVVKSVQKLRHRRVYGSDADNIISNARSKVNTGSNLLNTVGRSQSLSRISAGITTATSSERPKWAQQTDGAAGAKMTYYHKDAMKPNGIIATITRPPPVSPPPKTPKPTSRPVTARSARDPPSTELFPARPWKVPDPAESDND